MKTSFRVRLLLMMVLTVFTVLDTSLMAEEFKYYVWIDTQGVIHAEQEPPKGRDYEVRVIENINANVIPAEDFRLFGEIPIPEESDSNEGQAEIKSNKENVN